MTDPPGGRPSNFPTTKPLNVQSSLRPTLRRLVAEGDYANALAVADALLPTARDSEVERIAQHCRAKLLEEYRGHLGRIDGVPVVTIPPSGWLELDLDSRECFVLAHVDGVSNFEVVVDVTALPAHEAVRILCSLLERGIIRVQS